MGIDITSSVTRLEYFKGNKIPSDIEFCVRLDGSNFSNFTKAYKKPFDEEFADLMEYVVRELMKEYSEIVEITTHSDEISLFFSSNADLFNRRHEKIVSELAGKASALLSLKSGKLGHFDARVIILPRDTKEEYIKDRWLDAFRGCVNSVAYWHLRQSGMNARKATSILDGMNSKEKQELIFNMFGINISKLPSWQKQGYHFVYDSVKKEGFNPITKQKTQVLRRIVKEVGFSYLTFNK